MNTQTVYKYDEDGVYSGTTLAFEDPKNPGTYILPANTVETVPPTLSEPNVPVWNGSSWVATEDHRKHLNEEGNYEGGTPYWLPSEGDNYQSEPRYMTELGALPEGAVTTRPAKTTEEEQQEQLKSLISESKAYLSETDYRVIKFMDKYISEHPDIKAEFEAEYPDTLEERQDARDAINGAEASAQLAGIALN